MTDNSKCPLGLQNNCTNLKTFDLDNALDCSNYDYCRIMTTAWRLPYVYHIIDGIPCLTVLETCIDRDSSWHEEIDDHPIFEAMKYGWQPACSRDDTQILWDLIPF
jgi:hypothetical protein